MWKDNDPDKNLLLKIYPYPMKQDSEHIILKPQV